MARSKPVKAAKAAKENVVDPAADFLREEASSAGLLLLATVIALVWANSPLRDSYDSLWSTELGVGVGGFDLTEDLRHWVNDGLMALFFFVVGLEIKREFVHGELRHLRTAALPVIAAVGGALLPVAIFALLVSGGEEASGWAIPMATDIAFALGALALLGDRISDGVKLLLLSIAVVDDILAIGVIGIFYSDDVSFVWLGAAIGGLGLVVVLQRLGVSRVAVFAAVGVAVWIATFESGVHATIAGVALGLLTPARSVDGRDVLDEIEHRLHPISSGFVIPLFALANAGVYLGGGTLNAAVEGQLAWAIAIALVAGKLAGIGGSSFLSLRLRAGALPDGVRERQVWGVAALGGIGFTVSLFIADLAFESAQLQSQAKVGIFAGSLAAALAGLAILALRARPTSD